MPSKAERNERTTERNSQAGVSLGWKPLPDPGLLTDLLQTRHSNRSKPPCHCPVIQFICVARTHCRPIQGRRLVHLEHGKLVCLQCNKPKQEK